jgi:hypothetical protein
LAECIRGEADWFDSAGMPGPCGDSQPEASSSSIEELLWLLQLRFILPTSLCS